jgi:hypothetical protein
MRKAHILTTFLFIVPAAFFLAALILFAGLRVFHPYERMMGDLFIEIKAVKALMRFENAKNEMLLGIALDVLYPHEDRLQSIAAASEEMRTAFGDYLSTEREKGGEEDFLVSFASANDVFLRESDAVIALLADHPEPAALEKPLENLNVTNHAISAITTEEVKRDSDELNDHVLKVQSQFDAVISRAWGFVLSDILIGILSMLGAGYHLFRRKGWMESAIRHRNEQLNRPASSLPRVP